MRNIKKRRLYLDRINIGTKGEDIAKDYLEMRKFKIIKRNITTPFGELDIVAVKNSILVAIEVKTRSSEKFGSALYSITNKKKCHIINSFTHYINKNRLTGVYPRIDVIYIKLDPFGNFEMLEYIKNAISVDEFP